MNLHLENYYLPSKDFSFLQFGSKKMKKSEAERKDVLV